MNANQIYESAYTPEDYALWAAIQDHIPEVESYNISLANDTRLEFRSHFYHNFDGRRILQLGSIWFDGRPVMITQNAGREGDDHRHRYITDMDTYRAMVGYLLTLQGIDDFSQGFIIDPEKDMPELTSFYGWSFGIEDMGHNAHGPVNGDSM